MTNIETAWRPFEPCRENLPPATDFDCGLCGLANELPGTTFSEDDEFTCSDCGARNFVGIESDYDDEGESFSAYVSRYICKHGIEEEDPCDQCEIEFGGGVGEVG